MSPPGVTSVSIAADGLGKRYAKLHQDRMLLRSVLPFAKTHRSELWALRDVDLSVGAGETLGVLGRNGSGKSTLLRLLAGVTRPTSGTLRVVGRIAPLLSVGVGFNPNLSGRENILMNGLLLGMTKEEIADRLGDIVAFSELAGFVDTPVKFYSTGMFMRLGFSVAVHAEPEVLLVDEVLSVGDVAYQVRCAERIDDLRQRGTTVVFVSHSLATMHDLCTRSIVLDGGRVTHDGATEDAIGAYQEILSRAPEVDVDEAVRSGAHRRVVGGARIDAAELLSDGRPTRFVHTGEPVEFRATVHFDEDVDRPLFSFNVLGESGRGVYGIFSPVAAEHPSYRAGDVAVVKVQFDANLGKGTYRILVVVTSNDGREVHARNQAQVSFYAEAGDSVYGVAHLGATLFVDGKEVVDDRPAGRQRS